MYVLLWKCCFTEKSFCSSETRNKCNWAMFSCFVDIKMQNCNQVLMLPAENYRVLDWNMIYCCSLIIIILHLGYWDVYKELDGNYEGAGERDVEGVQEVLLEPQVKLRWSFAGWTFLCHWRDVRDCYQRKYLKR